MFGKKVGANVIEQALKGLKKVVADLDEGVKLVRSQIEANTATLESKRVEFQKLESDTATQNADLAKSAESAEVAKENISKLLGL